MSSSSFETIAIHTGQAADAGTGATVPPIHMTSTFTQSGLGENRGFEYSRVSNPTRNAMEECLAALEGGEACAAFASGMAATTAVLHSLRPGDGVVAGFNLYGGTYRALEQIFKPWGLQVVYARDDRAESYREAMGQLDRPRLMWIETPTNPLLTITDIAACVAIAREANVKVCVDNTFATPYLQRPLELGADLVVHSLTKYLGGHSDLLGGAVIARDATDLQPIRFYQKAAGGILSPFESWLVQRGLKTLAVRMERHCDNAERIARELQSMRGIAEVIYPGLPEHPDYAMARKQMRRFGGMLSVRVEGGLERTKKFLASLKLFSLAESLGGVESLVGYPAKMSHAGMSAEARAARGIGDELVRFSVGIESANDLIEDIRQALG